MLLTKQQNLALAIAGIVLAIVACTCGIVAIILDARSEVQAEVSNMAPEQAKVTIIGRTPSNYQIYKIEYEGITYITMHNHALIRHEPQEEGHEFELEKEARRD
jgi:hypothetical protein